MGASCCVISGNGPTSLGMPDSDMTESYFTVNCQKKGGQHAENEQISQHKTR